MSDKVRHTSVQLQFELIFCLLMQLLRKCSDAKMTLCFYELEQFIKNII